MKHTLDVDSRPCEFCNEFSGGHENSYARRYGNSADSRELLNDGVFRVLPTLGQLVKGHLLIVPGRHITAMADLNIVELDRLESICRLASHALQQEYGRVSFFEHGIRGTNSGGCGIDHAHLHALPVVSNGILKTLTQEFGGCAIDHLAQIKQAVAPQASYLFFEDSFATRYVFPVTNLPSQYMRKLVADYTGQFHWDWRKCGPEPGLIVTLQRLAPLFSSVTTSTE